MLHGPGHPGPRPGERATVRAGGIPPLQAAGWPKSLHVGTRQPNHARPQQCIPNRSLPSGGLLPRYVCKRQNDNSMRRVIGHPVTTPRGPRSALRVMTIRDGRRDRAGERSRRSTGRRRARCLCGDWAVSGPALMPCGQWTAASSGSVDSGQWLGGLGPEWGLQAANGAGLA